MTSRRAGARLAGALLCTGALLATMGGPVTAAVDGGGHRQGVATASGDVVRPLDDMPDLTVPVMMNNGANNRTVDSAIQRGVDSNVYVWGRTGRGIDGAFSSDTIGPRDREWPRQVEGLPEGNIRAVTAGIYNFNALDYDGHVWGWGAYSASRDGTGSVQERDGRLGCIGMSVQPERLRIGSAWNGDGPLLDGVVQISSTEMAGAALTGDGSVYKWGRAEYGGNPGVGDGCAKNPVGAQKLEGLPDPSIPGNRPVHLKGGYKTFWVVLENGDVYYWGGASTYERPRTLDGGKGDATGTQHVAQRSTVLNDWNRANSPGSYIVQLDSGINLGGALLSDGRVLTWGTNAGRVGGRLPNDTKAATLRAARAPGVLPNMSDVVALQYTFTGAAMITRDGTLYGYGDDSYECFPTWPGKNTFCGGVAYDTVPGQLDTGVTAFSVGQGHIRWTKQVRDDAAPTGLRYETWGQGYNPRGAIGHPVGTVKSKRLIEFQTPKKETCTELRCDLDALLHGR